MYQHNAERDELRARFTKWMEVTLFRARRRYLQKNNRAAVISLESLPEAELPVAEIPVPKGFDFETEWLAEAFAQLSSKRQEILTLLFVEEWRPAEAAGMLHCTVRQVYNREHQALEALRKNWKERSEEDENK